MPRHARIDISSSSSRGSRAEPEKPRSLQLVVYPGLGKHWGIFFPDDSAPNTTKGLFYDLSFLGAHHTTQDTSRTICVRHRRRDYAANCREWDSATYNGAQYIELPGARSTRESLDAATNRIFRDFKYELLHENCQTFVIETLRILNRWQPGLVTQASIEFVTRKSALSVRATQGRRERRNILTDTMNPENQRMREVASRGRLPSQVSSSQSSYSEGTHTPQRRLQQLDGGAEVPDENVYQMRRTMRDPQQQPDRRAVASGSRRKRNTIRGLLHRL